MKNPDRFTVTQLTDLPNIGPAMARDLRILGIERPQQLIGQDPLAMYDDLCLITEQDHDPCVIDVFMSVVRFMEGGEPRPWWEFTGERKAGLAGKKTLAV